MSTIERLNRKAKKEFTILYVDDEMPNLRGFRSSFKWHYNVFTALNGFEALEILKENKIHLIITDQRMPEMLGTELLRTVHGQDPSIRRMILSGFIKHEDLGDAVGTYGIHEFVTKPWDFEDLKGIFDSLLRNEDVQVKSFVA